MRKIVVSEFLSADGVMEAPDTWQFPFQTEEMGAITERQIRDTDAFLLGRVTYEIFAAFWPTQTHNEFGVADKLNSAPKYVVSTTLQKADWNNSTQIKSNVIEEIRTLKQQPGGNIGITGSATLVHSLLDADLVDEVQVLVHPIVLGKGVHLFGDGGRRLSMKLADSMILPNGVVFLAYQIEHQA
ncbi:MAG TPA: dihydrofolate reductase family protein [Ktedonobacterales bacterium]|nr:dihydrofolate reductase family protein [Ktedonobacterales bacterium]